VEADLASGLISLLKVRVVGLSMVSPAQQTSVFDVGVATLGPTGVVMGLAARHGQVAILGGATVVANVERHPHGLGVQTALAADIEWL